MSNKIYYKQGYKYQLTKNYTYFTLIKGYDIKTNFIELNQTGVLIINSGYAWNGASGGVDTKSSMRGSLVHDALYQLMRLQLIRPHNREYADEQLRDICIQDGMYTFRAWTWFYAVRKLAAYAIKKSEEPKELEAP